jgi:glycosyltransferase involved in cell wall biosynthesis
MKILASGYKHSGCSYHRVLLPLMNMSDVKAKLTDKVEAMEEEDYDIYFFNRINNAYDGKLDIIRRKHNCKIVLDIDDSWELPYNHILYDKYLTQISHLIVSNIEQADVVMTTTEKLADKIYKHNKNVLVVPNAIPYGYGQFNDEKEESVFTRIFWCGGSTHEEDIRLLANPMKRLSAHSKLLKVVVGGYYNSNPYEQKIWNNIVNYMTYNRTLPYEIYGGLDTQHYMELYNHSDICAIPLVDGQWHSYKSNLKILEAAAKKCAVVVSDVEPYNLDKDAPVLWVKNQSDWYKHFKKLINEKEQRTELGERLFEWAKSKYNFAEINGRRKRTFESLVNAQAHI